MRTVVRQILAEVAEAMRDPDRVVLESGHIFENFEGEMVFLCDERVRACPLGHTMLIGKRLIPDDDDERTTVLNEVHEALGPSGVVDRFSWEGLPPERVADEIDALLASAA